MSSRRRCSNDCAQRAASWDGTASDTREHVGVWSARVVEKVEAKEQARSQVGDLLEPGRNLNCGPPDQGKHKTQSCISKFTNTESNSAKIISKCYSNIVPTPALDP